MAKKKPEAEATTDLWHMLDASYLPGAIPPCDILAGYLQSPGTGHPWTPNDWARAKAHCPGLVPIFVAVPGGDAIAGAHYGAEAVNQARGLAIPDGSVIVLDIEHTGAADVIESGQAHAFIGAVATAGFVPVIYASATDEALVKPLGKLWLASWGQPAALLPGSVMTQYDGGKGKAFDQSVVSKTLHIAGLSPEGGNGTVPEHSPTVGFANTPSGDGYWQVTQDGHIYSFGDAEYLHSPADPHFAHVPIKGIVGHPKHQGYWVLGVDGSVYAYGAAKYHGNFSNGVLHPGA